MSNETSEDKSWLKRNWKWFVPFSFLLVLLAVLLLGSAGNASNFATAFKDEVLYKKAIEKCNDNEQVQKVLGRLSDVDKMAILESTVDYRNNNQKVKLSVRVNGKKGKGKMDVIADKIRGEWHYSLVKIRMKNPKQEIIVLE
jgi:hypothetical protein